jgi:hypothetical protein
MTTIVLETHLWNWLKIRMTGRWRADRIENRLTGAMSDVVYVLKGDPRARLSWMELKVIDGTTKNTVPKVLHYTEGQKDFLTDYQKEGVPASLLFYDRTWGDIVLLTGESVLLLGSATGKEIREKAAYHELSVSFDVDKFVKILLETPYDGQRP